MDKKTLANIILCLLLVIAVGVGLEKTSSALTPKGLFVKRHIPSPKTAHLLDFVELKKYIVLGKSGNRVDSTFLIYNHSDEDVRNIMVHCEFFDGSGKFADRHDWVLHDIFKAGEVQEYGTSGPLLINSRAKAVNCEIVDLQPVEKPFFTLQRRPSHVPSHASVHTEQLSH